MTYADEAEAALAKTCEEGSFSYLPGMSYNDFDYCTCGLGWPMGWHHVWDCPAHCICGHLVGDTKRTCAYHSGLSSKIPTGPSVMTERWDLKQDLKPDLPEEQRVQQMGKSESNIPGETTGEETSGETPLSRL